MILRLSLKLGEESRFFLFLSSSELLSESEELDDESELSSLLELSWLEELVEVDPESLPLEVSSFFGWEGSIVAGFSGLSSLTGVGLFLAEELL